MEATDKELLEWHLKGWRDECHGTTTVESDKAILNFAYQRGARDYIIGDDNPIVDAQTDEEIVKAIRDNGDS